MRKRIEDGVMVRIIAGKHEGQAGLWLDNVLDYDCAGTDGHIPVHYTSALVLIHKKLEAIPFRAIEMLEDSPMTRTE